jgi:hypothetical protein
MARTDDPIEPTRRPGDDDDDDDDDAAAAAPIGGSNYDEDFSRRPQRLASPSRAGGGGRVSDDEGVLSPPRAAAPRRRRRRTSGALEDARAHGVLAAVLVVVVATAIAGTGTASAAAFQPPLVAPRIRAAGRGGPALDVASPRRTVLMPLAPSRRTLAILAAHGKRFGEQYEESNGDPANGNDDDSTGGGVADMKRVRWSLEQLYNSVGDGETTEETEDTFFADGPRGDCANANDNNSFMSTSVAREEEAPPHLQEESVVQLTTAAQRYRSQLEIMLLESLEGSDDAVDELVHLWVHETTPHNAEVLEQMSNECSPGMKAEQAWLRQTIQKHPDWVEPQIRLATLLFYKGETQPSRQWAVRAFEKMPYHFEIVPLLVMICLRQSNVGEAIRWARRGLPTLRGTEASQRRRSAWVRKATDVVRRRQQQQLQEQLQDEMLQKKKEVQQEQQQSVIDSATSWQ